MELRELLRFTRRWLWLMLIGAVLGGGAAYFFIISQTPQYRASTRLMVSQPNESVAAEFSSITDKELAETYRNMIVLKPVLEDAGRQLGFEINDRQISSQVIEGTKLLELSVQDESPARAVLIADALVADAPELCTANPLKRTRTGKIFIDYLRNARGSSAICNYSPRAQPGAPVATPLRWAEVAKLKSGAPYSVKTLPARLSRLKTDPWEGFFGTRQSITPRAKKVLGIV